MNTKVFLFLAGFLLCMYSCNTDSNEMQKDDASTGMLYAMGIRDATGTRSSEMPLILPDPEVEKPPQEPSVKPDPPEIDDHPPMEMVFTGNDIISFNVKTGEIKFSGEISEKLANGFYRDLSMYLNNEPLFDEEIKTQYGFDSMCWWGYVVLYIWFDYDEALNKRINPKFHFYNSERIEPNQGSVRKYDSEKRKKDWDSFKKYLSDAGKIINQ
jgi:hypothetical protein